MQLGRDWLARIFWNQAHIAATAMIDMKRTYQLVYAIRKRLVCKVILESSTSSGNNNNDVMKRTYHLVYAMRK
jgi:hypothetical protein